MKSDLLDVIIIGKNESRVLQRTLISVIKASEVFEKKFNSKPNIIYIDSNSTDNSVSIAKNEGISCKVIKGKTSPAIGRIEGVEQTNSKYIFFLDGDTEVELNWLAKGVEFLEQNEDIAGVGGRLVFNIYNAENEIIWQNNNYRNNKRPIENIYDGVGGTFLYKRKPYLESGGFSTNYRNTEEFDLMLKIVAKGHLVKRINIPMAIHNDYKTEDVSFVKRYLFTKDIFISGRVCRNAPKTFKTFMIVLGRYWLYILQLPLIILVFLTLLNKLWYSAGIILFLVIIFNFIHKKFNIKRSILSMISMCFYSLGFYFGLLKNHE